MSDDLDTVSLMYPDTATPAITGVQTESPGDEAVQDMYPKDEQQPAEKTTGNPYALEEDKGTVTDDLYGAESKVELSNEIDLSVIYSDPEYQESLKSNLGYLAQTCGADQNDIASLVDTCNQQLITGEQYDQGEVMKSLYTQHGSDLNSKLQAAKSLVASYPELSAWLDQTGAGDNPKIINQIIKISSNPRAQARLQKMRNRK